MKEETGYAGLFFIAAEDKRVYDGKKLGGAFL